MNKKGYILISLFIILILFSGIIQAADYLPLDKIKPGMTGVGKTVFKGTDVEEFPVQIISILKDQGMNGDLILIKTGGPQIEKIGGIAAGMSGSPVYIDGKIIGAIGYGWSFSDHRYGLVTPIESMLKLFDKKGNVIKGKSNKQPEQPELNTPLYVSGLKGRALDNLKRDLPFSSLKVLPIGGLKEKTTVDSNNGSNSGGEDINKIQPGSAIAVQLVRGDINVASIGTLTYVKGNKVLAFGHPFTNKGDVNFLLSEAYINGVVPSIEQPFKLGSPYGSLLGEINIDRGAGIAGKLKQFPAIVPLKINVLDKDRGVKKNVSVQIVNNERFLTTLASNVALQSLDNTLDRLGKGTAWLDMKIMANGLPDLEIEKKNMYYSQSDIASSSLSDFYRLLGLINSNPFTKINIINMELNFEVSSKDKVALVQEAKVLNENIKPGDKLNIEVTLHPYRSSTITKIVSIKLPEDIQPGLSSVVINGGYTGASSPVIDHTEQDYNYEINQAQAESYKDFKSMLDDFMEEPGNNDLVVQIYPGFSATAPIQDTPVAGSEVDQNKDKSKDQPNPDKPQDGSLKDSNNKDKADEEASAEEPEIKKVEKTDYVLEGSLTLDIDIQGPASKPVDSNIDSPTADSKDNKTEKKSKKVADKETKKDDKI